MRPSILVLLSVALTLSSTACQKDAEQKPNSVEPSEVTSSKPSTTEPSKSSELLDVPWRIIWLNGNPLVPEDTVKPAEVTFDTKEQRVHGSGGCNRFFGTYSLDGRSLNLSQMGATRMACVKGMDKEQQILTALGETGRFEIVDSTLRLYDKKDQLRMKLVPAAPEDALEPKP